MRCWVPWQWWELMGWREWWVGCWKKLPRLQEAKRSLKAFRAGLPKMCCFGMWIIFSWRQLRPCELQRDMNLSLKEIKCGTLPIIKVSTRNNFVWPVSKAGQTSNHSTSVLIHLQMTFLPSEATGAKLYSLTQGVTYISFFLSASEPLMCVRALTLSCMWGSRRYICN